MSILGIGTDLVKIERIEAMLVRHPTRFIKRCFTVAEAKELTARSNQNLAATIAGRWAAKEALLKSLGGDIRNIPYQDVSVSRKPNCGPVIQAHGLAAEAFSLRGARRAHLSISHEKEYAIAIVILES